VRRQGRPEGVERVDGTRYAVEADALEADFPYELCGAHSIFLTFLWVGGGEGVEDVKTGWGVEGYERGSLDLVRMSQC
jgi:hypothetical protein